MSKLFQRRTKTKSKLNYPIFGHPLEQVLEEQQELIPTVVSDCVTWLEKHALEEEGLFRIPGDQSQIEAIKIAYSRSGDKNGHVDFDTVTGELHLSPHVVAGVLKVFFRELPQPVLPHRLYATFLKVAKNSNEDLRRKNLRLLVQGLPSHNRFCLLYLLRFLKKYSENSLRTKMDATNLALCWGPNILRSHEDTKMESLAIDATTVVHILETLISEVDYMAEVPTKHNLVAPEDRPYPEGQISGWLVKQGGSVKTWKRRWFVFQDLVLFYFKSEKESSASALGKIPVLSYMVEKADKDNTKKPFPFKLTHPGPCRTWYFSASSESARDKWMTTINTAVSKVSKASPTISRVTHVVIDNDDDVEEVEPDTPILSPVMTNVLITPPISPSSSYEKSSEFLRKDSKNDMSNMSSVTSREHDLEKLEKNLTDAERDLDLLEEKILQMEEEVMVLQHEVDGIQAKMDEEAELEDLKKLAHARMPSYSNLFKGFNPAQINSIQTLDDMNDLLDQLEGGENGENGENADVHRELHGTTSADAVLKSDAPTERDAIEVDFDKKRRHTMF
eukprot:TRINITY_DN4162_c0_g1_i1.p1 TRINITY_DN4162_c0_g1~~TRINITY_DN4162_c0_g1_i1.p1  ORF type:complete len:561 (+),score=167.40 TRINITY_DN4162_c0_g1_i1:1839-3521(+)